MVALLATIGVILAAAYMLWLSKRVIFGEIKNPEIKSLKDINFSEGIMLFILAAVIIIFGFYPDPLLDTINVSVDNLLENYQKDLIYHLNVSKW